MKITFVAAEAAPYAKVGGLGDVTSSLAKALAKKGHDLSIIIPAYSCIPKLKEKEIITEIEVPMPNGPQKVILRQDLSNGFPFVFIEDENYFSREKIYGYPDDAYRFTFFCKAALESLRVLGFPDVLHIHDWHTCALPLFLTSLYTGEEYSRIATVLTIHNLAFQGVVDLAFLDQVGIPILPSDQRVEHFGKVNLLKGGILTSDMITTVSETYALEIQTPALGEGLEGVLALKKKHLVGILNGIDEEEFDPREFGYKGGDPLQFKSAMKERLQRRLGLPLATDTPLLAMVSRLTEQKGVDLILAAMENIMSMVVQLVILGTGQKNYEDSLREMAQKFPALSAQITFDPELAKLIYAGADIFLMPSRFEPCGLGQMIAMRYGTIPLVRRTGGLADSVQPYNPETGVGNGFLFSEYSPQALLDTLRKALELYQDREQWESIVRNALATDFSWNRAVPHYLDVYRKASFLHLKKAGLVIPPEIRKDPILEEWAIIAKDRIKRPNDFKVPPEDRANNVESCPFCEGHEAMTPDELFAIRPPESRPNEPGWSVRVVDNKFPALIKYEEPIHEHSWLYTSLGGSGAHEVIVESPEHFLDLPELSKLQIQYVLQAFRQRYRELSRVKDLRYILIFRNHGRSAGASLSHPHSQLIATPIVPRRIKDELDSAHLSYEHTGECVFCALIREELEFAKRVVLDTEEVCAFEPFASRFPFETTIILKRHEAAFSDLEDEEIPALAEALQTVLGRLKSVVNDPPYNMMIHSAPLGFLSNPYYHWHIEIIPRLTTPAGFEWGTDFYINPTPPEEAARFLRGE